MTACRRLQSKESEMLHTFSVRCTILVVSTSLSVTVTDKALRIYLFRPLKRVEPIQNETYRYGTTVILSVLLNVLHAKGLSESRSVVSQFVIDRYSHKEIQNLCSHLASVLIIVGLRK